MIIPGVQKPHCRPWHSQKPCCTACRLPLVARPSIVRTSAPSACTANIVHDFTARPSASTVHAPQMPVSHPTCVPVRLHWSRRKCTSSSRGSTSPWRGVPLTVRRTGMVTDPSVREDGALIVLEKHYAVKPGVRVKVLITGGTGYLGRAIVGRLAARGHTPVVFARSASKSALPGIMIDADIRDAGAVERAASGCDAICHTAALVSVW